MQIENQKSQIPIKKQPIPSTSSQPKESYYLKKNLPSLRRPPDQNKVFFEQQKKHLCSGGISIKKTKSHPT